MKTKNNPGIKTTEFHTLVALYFTSALAFMVGVGWIDSSLAEELKANIVNFAQLSAGIGTAAYIVFRSLLKAAAEIRGKDTDNAM